MLNQKIWDYLGYSIIFMIMLGQVVVSIDVLWGNGVYLVCNLVSVVRTFSLKRPACDKVKDVACLALTLGIILLKVF